MVVYNPLFHLVYCKKHPKDIVDMGLGNMLSYINY